MLFDTLRKKNRAEKEEQEWNAQRPADYESQNKAAMDAVTGQVGSGFDWDTVSKAYQQYRAQAAGNAAAAAENAKANAAALAGGYGSSYADSVAAQGQTQALAGIDNAVPDLRSQALSEYRNGQNSLLTALSGMANTEALDRSAYGANLANYENRQNFLANQSEQARNENSNYWSNLWNQLKNVGEVAMTAYNGYMGYTAQQKQMELQQKQWEMQVISYAAELKKAGADDAANALLDQNNLDRSILDNYTGISRDDQAKALLQGADLLGSGYVEAAGNYAGLYGLDAGQLGSYDAITSRQLRAALQEYAAKQNIAAQYKTTGSGSSKSSGSSGSSGKSSSSQWTNSQLRQMASDYKKMKPTDEMYPFYRQTLIDYGWIQDDSGQSETKTGGSLSAGSKLALSPSSKWSGTSGNTNENGKSKGTGMTYSNALSYAKGWSADGVDADTIYARLVNMGISDDVAAKVWNSMGW